MRHSDDRFEQRLGVDLLVSVVGREGHRETRARNLSSGGVQLQRGFERLALGESVELALRLPDVQVPIRCGATVVYERGLTAGLAFRGLQPREEALIEAYLTARRPARR